MEKEKKIDWRKKFAKDQIWTVPNILSFCRLAFIPFIVWAYCTKKWYFTTLILIVISGLTDVVDGIIARRLNQITDFGKFIDPVADKLTQIAVLICLLTRYPLMALLLGIMLVKEVVAFIMRFILFRKTENVTGAAWHGKTTTVFLYLLMGVHIVWYAIPNTLSTVFIILCGLMMILSFVLYTVSFSLALIKFIRNNQDVN